MADTSPSKLPQTFWIGALLLFALLGLMYLLGLAELKKSHETPLPVIGPIAGFTLTNQDGQVTTLADLSNHVWVADIIFTRCAGPCPIITGFMKSLEEALPQTSGAKLVTLTTDPDFDAPPIMKRYGERYNADFSRWMFLTGTKAEIGALAANSLKLSAVPVKPGDQKDAADLFVHTTIFVVVDKHAQLRGIFETLGEGVDWPVQKGKILSAVQRLEQEP